MTTALGVVAFVLIVAVVHWMRTAANDVMARGVDGLISQVRSAGPTVWAIAPGSTDAETLLAAVDGASASAFGGTNFSVAVRGGERTLRCSTPADSDLDSVRVAVMAQVRQADPACRLQL